MRADVLLCFRESCGGWCWWSVCCAAALRLQCPAKMRTELKWTGETTLRLLAGRHVASSSKKEIKHRCVGPAAADVCCLLFSMKPHKLKDALTVRISQSEQNETVFRSFSWCPCWQRLYRCLLVHHLSVDVGDSSSAATRRTIRITTSNLSNSC